MTEQELTKHLKWCRFKYDGYGGDDIFQEACMIALERYGALENVKQSLFGMLCREAFRKIRSEEEQYISFSFFTKETADDFDEQFDFADPKSMQEFERIEDINELEKLLGETCLEKCLEKLLNAEKPASKVKTKKYIQESLFA